MCRPTEHPASGVLTSTTDLKPDDSDDNRTTPPQPCELSSLNGGFLCFNCVYGSAQIHVGLNCLSMVLNLQESKLTISPKF